MRNITDVVHICVMLADTDWFNRCAAIHRIRRPNNLVVLVVLWLFVVDRTSSFVLDEVKSSGEQQLIPPSVTTFDSLSPQQQQTSSSSSSLSGSSSLSLLDDFDLGRRYFYSDFKPWYSILDILLYNSLEIVVLINEVSNISIFHDFCISKSYNFKIWNSRFSNDFLEK